MFADREITCLDCNQPFVFTAGEQEFYDRKGFKEEPKRCKNCRDSRKMRRTDKLTEGVDRGNVAPRPAYDDDDIGNRMPSGGGNARPAPARSAGRSPRPVRGGGGGGGGEREMFDAVCAQCSAQTRVPFRPVAGRPVYCRECYGARRGAEG